MILSVLGPGVRAIRGYRCFAVIIGGHSKMLTALTNNDLFTNRFSGVKCEEDHDVMKEMAIEDNSDRLRGGTQGGSAVCPG